MSNTRRLSWLLSRVARVFSEAKNDEVVVNRDSPATEFTHAAFLLKDIGEKWLYFAKQFLSGQEDPGPTVALHTSLTCLKNLYYTKNKEWEAVRTSVPITVGLIKATSDCGNSSVSMGLASVYLRDLNNQAVALLNCGTGGVRFQLYIKTAGKIMCLLEYKPSPDIGHLSSLKVGSFGPSSGQECSEEKIVAEIQKGLASAPWMLPIIMKKLKKCFGVDTLTPIPVFAFVTGKIRNHWEEKETGLLEATVNRLFGSVGGVQPFTNMLPPSSSSSITQHSYMISQALEGAMELVAVRTLYAQFSQVCNRRLEPVISLGIGRGSSQWTTVDPACPDDFWKYSLTPLKYGMDDHDSLASGLPTAIYRYCANNGTALALLMRSVGDRGNSPVIALKSGCLIALDDARGGKELRKSLCETSLLFKRMHEPTVRVGRANSTVRRSYELSTTSPAVACAEVGALLVSPEEAPRPEFLAVQLEGKSGFLDDLDQVTDGDVLIFYAVSDLVAKPPKPEDCKERDTVGEKEVPNCLPSSGVALPVRPEEAGYCPHTGCFELLPCPRHVV